jgi:hypothetical protein
MSKWGSGYIYKKSGAWHLQFYQIEKNAAGELVKVRRSQKLCKAKGVTQKHVNGLASAAMVKIESRTTTEKDMPICEFWEHHYLPCKEAILPLTGKPRKKSSTMRGYKQIWRQHLKGHFGTRALQQYEPDFGTQLFHCFSH